MLNLTGIPRNRMKKPPAGLKDIAGDRFESFLLSQFKGNAPFMARYAAGQEKVFMGRFKTMLTDEVAPIACRM